MMKKNLLLLFASLLVAMGASAQVTVCGTYPEESGQVSSPYIKSGTVTWDATSRTLTLDNAVIEYSSNNPQDGIRPIRVTDDATIVVQGDCRLSTTGYVAIALNSYNSKNVTIKGNGTLSTSSSWIDIFLVMAHLTIQDITLNSVKGIANNTEGTGVALAFDNVQATIQGEVARIGDGITFNNCAITYPEDAYLEQTGYGYIIYHSNQQLPDKIIISRNGSGVKGDVNNDGEVNIADVNAVINIILGNGGNNSAADVNGDHEVNIADVNMIINIILGIYVPTPDHEWVDLGLPSGTLWATCNVGANSPEEYGDYFAWGEIAPKDNYSESNYKWYSGSWYNHSRSITKYCTDSEYGYNGFIDYKTELDPEDDAAYVNWGPAWRMPSTEQINELSDCPAQWTQRNGVYGELFTGPNGNTLFLPAAGYCTYDSLEEPGTSGFYWSRKLSSAQNFAYCLWGNSDGWGWWHFYRDCGFTVRAVRVSQN
jgi:hypothetical protein